MFFQRVRKGRVLFRLWEIPKMGVCRSLIPQGLQECKATTSRMKLNDTKHGNTRMISCQ